MDEWTKALDLRGDSAELLLARGVSYARANEPDSALQDFDRALAREPGDARAFYQRGVLFSARVMNPGPDSGSRPVADTALANFDRALALDGKLADAYLARARLREFLGRDAAAILDYRQLSKAPNADSATRAAAGDRLATLTRQPSIYVHYVDPRDRRRATEVVAKLRGAGGWRPFGPDLRTDGKTRGDVRYVSKADSVVAEKVATVARGALTERPDLRLPVLPIDTLRYPNVPRRGHLELWLPSLGAPLPLRLKPRS